jgi:hypothetical protein
MQAALENYLKQQHRKAAAIVANNLSELSVTLGALAKAVKDAELSVANADQSGDAFLPLAFRATHADALNQAGRRAEAEARFRVAEQMQADDDSDHTLLYGIAGFRYCDLLLAEAERAAWPKVVQCFSPTTRTKSETGTLRELKLGTTLAALRAVSERAARALKWAEMGGQGSLLDIALNYLTLGRAALYAAILDSPDSALRIPHSELDSAVSGLRRAGQQQYLPLGLLTRAWQRSITGALTSAQAGPESAQSDLDEAWEIAERGPMPLFLADIHLTRCRLFGMTNVECRMSKGQPLEKYPWTSAQHDLAEARRLIHKHGYLRRLPELEDAEAAARALGILPPP